MLGLRHFVLVLGEHEAAADRVVRLLRDHRALGVHGGELQRVGVPGVDDAGEQRDGVVVEGDGVAAREQHLAVGADLLPADDGVLGVDGLRPVALEPEDDGVRRAVADPGGAERAVELHAHPRDPGSAPRSSSRATNRFAARIGPTVCELDGPIPMEKRSKTLITRLR